VRTGRARSKIRHYLKTLAQTESETWAKLLAQALRAEGIESLPETTPTRHLGQAAALHRQPHAANC
jgi:GTP pyrophosphokinase